MILPILLETSTFVHGTDYKLITIKPIDAAFFASMKALEERDSVLNDAAIYALDPLALNGLSEIYGFPVTWVQNPVLQTMKIAFGTHSEPVNGKTIPVLELPTAIYPSTIHARIKSQKGCFTLHGYDKRDIETILQNKQLIRDQRLIKYIIPKENVNKIFHELNEYGITYATLFPDLDGLAKELKYQFNIES